MVDFTTPNGEQIISTAVMHAQGARRLHLEGAGADADALRIESSNPAIVSASLTALFDAAKGIWILDLSANTAGKADLIVKVAGTVAATLPVSVEAHPELPAASTDVGMLARLFIAESRLPGTPGFNPAQARTGMSYMRIVLENRLKHPMLFEAPHAKSLKDIVKAPNAFQGFQNYPVIGPSQKIQLDNVVQIANDSQHPKQADFAEILLCAIEVAKNGPGIPDPSPIGLYGWKNSGSGSPSPNFVAFGKPLNGNQFYTLKEPPVPLHEP